MNIPHMDMDRFNLPKVLELVRPLGCTQPDLFDHLRLGRLHAVCFPYRLEPEREVAIEPDEWPEWYRDSYIFPVFDGYIGELEKADHGTPVPLHIIPRAARADCERVLIDGGKAAESAVVYVLQDELIRFTKRLSGAQHGPQEAMRSGARLRPGRKKGTGSFASLDAPLLEEMKKMIAQGTVLSTWAAALKVAGKAAGAGTLESKAKRLLKRFSE